MSREGDATDTGSRPETPDALRQAPGFLARRLYQAYQAAWARHVDATLTGPQFAVLVTVEVHPEVDQGTLASSVALDRSTMADVCRRLEDRGLIARRTAPSDGRRKLLTLTEAGSATLQDIGARVRSLEDELLADHDDEARRRLLDDLNGLSESWEKITGSSRLV